MKFPIAAPLGWVWDPHVQEWVRYLVLFGSAKPYLVYDAVTEKDVSEHETVEEARAVCKLLNAAALENETP